MTTNSLAWNLQILMTKKGLSVNDLAQMTGISTQQLRRLRSGTRTTYTQELLLSLAAALDVTPNQLLITCE
jgi:DNA-binding Xre family transcriptional regulator